MLLRLWMDQTEQWLRLGASTHELLCSSAETIAYRSLMLMQTTTGQVSPADPEFRHMAQEKIDACLQMCAKLGEAMTQPELAGQAKLLHECIAPFNQRASANAKRLRRKHQPLETSKKPSA